jgi:hypothetical protein
MPERRMLQACLLSRGLQIRGMRNKVRVIKPRWRRQVEDTKKHAEVTTACKRLVGNPQRNRNGGGTMENNMKMESRDIVYKRDMCVTQ